MVYTLTQGARGYNDRLHYSLYGGVEYFPNRRLAVKELLPLIAIPVVAIAFLVAIINFHIPVLSPATGGGQSGTDTSAAATRPVVLSASTTAANAGAAAAGSSTSSTTGTGSAAVGPATPVGTDNGQGIIGGMGGDESGGAVTPPVDTTPPATPPLLDVNAGTDAQTAQVGVDVFVPVADTPVSAGVNVGL